MRIDRSDARVVAVAVSERNVRTLLAKVAMIREGDSTAGVIFYPGTATEPTPVITVEPDDDHYAARGAGEMSPDTEERVVIDRLREQRQLSDGMGGTTASWSGDPEERLADALRAFFAGMAATDAAQVAGLPRQGFLDELVRLARCLKDRRAAEQGAREHRSQ